MSNALPGASTSKTFTVKNTGNVRQKYDIDLINVTNTFINNELIYSITSNNIDGGEVLNQVVPTTESTLLTSYIDPGVTITYTMTVKFKETGSNQNANQGATFSGKLQIIPRIMGVALGGYIYGDDDNVLPGVTVELHSDPIIITTDSNGYYEILDAPVGVHTLYIKQGGTTLGSKEITLISSAEPKLENNEISLSDYMNAYVNIKVDGGLNINLVQLSTVMEKILADNTAQSDIGINFANRSSDTNGKGLYYTSDNQYGENDTRIYYFRGRVENNWVSFGGFLWRIVRTTSEGGVKLVYSGDGIDEYSGFLNFPYPNPYSEEAYEEYENFYKFNVNFNSKYYVGYTYNRDLNGYTGTQTDSTIKTNIDNWYKTNFIDNTEKNKYIKYLSTTAIYCADRSSEIIDEGLNNMFQAGVDTILFPAVLRLAVYNRPTYACPSTNASRYTVSTNSGNGYLQYPVALLTADEINYAGLIYDDSRNYDSYINDNIANEWFDDMWYTLTPVAFFSDQYDDNFSSIGIASSYGIGLREVTSSNLVRPAVSLKSNVIVYSGNGTKGNPYIIK